MIEERVRTALTTGDPDAAAGALWRILASADDKPRAVAAIVQACWEADRLPETLPLLDRLIVDSPSNNALRLTRGLILMAVDRAEQAIGDFDAMLRESPMNVGALCGRGSALILLDRLTEARDALRRAETLSPDDVSIQSNLAHVSLALGDYAEGWRYYESRLVNPHPSRALARVDAPRWVGGSDPRGRTILLQAEQGYGDTIQFCRFAPVLAAQGCKVRLSVPRPLVRLLRTLPDIDVMETGAAIGHVDHYSPLMSLPQALGEIPADVPYLRADPVLVARWRQRLSTLRGTRIGLAWATNAHVPDGAVNAASKGRSIPPSRLGPLIAEPNATFVSLQVDRQIDGVIDCASDLHDFADTAALIEALDLIITVDTAVAHLAGALGKPVWIMLRHAPCWRWLRNRDDSPWYPTARLFRQATQGDWDPVVEAIHEALRQSGLIC